MLSQSDIDKLWVSGNSARDKFKTLREYYEGKHAISGRAETYLDGVDKSEIVTNWIGLGIDLYVGALTSMPYQISLDSGATDRGGIDFLREISRDNDLPAIDVENLRKVLIYGYSIEWVEVGEGGDIIVREGDPREWVLVRDDLDEVRLAIRRISLPAGTYLEEEFLDQATEIQTVIDAEEIVDSRRSINGNWTEINRVPHSFGRVPVVVWQVNKERSPFMGDDLKSQQDEYNDIDSTSGDDIRNHTNSKLITRGVDSAWIMSNQEAIEKYNILPLPEDASAEYINRANDIDRVSARLTRTRENLHNMMKIPDIATIVGTTGATSGVALKLKFQPMMQRAEGFIHYLKKGVRARIELFNAISAILKRPTVENYAVSIEFVLPVNQFEEWQYIKGLDGLVSRETQLGLLSFIEDPIAELAKVAAEATNKPIDESDPDAVVAKVDAVTETVAAAIGPTAEAAIQAIADAALDEIVRSGRLETAIALRGATEAAG